MREKEGQQMKNIQKHHSGGKGFEKGLSSQL